MVWEAETNQTTPMRDEDSRHDITSLASRAREQETVGSETHAARRNTASYLTHDLPFEAVMVAFLEEYFASVHWFSLVIYEPRFRPAFNSIRGAQARPSQRPFLLLLSVVLGLGAWYRAQRPQTSERPTPAESRSWSARLISNAESQLIELLDQSSVTAVQTLILLGSFFVYHGRPNLSFSLLGATVKCPHAAGLHKDPVGMPDAEAEERKRVWWTIYTWDRFSSVTYGRPISIYDNDCSVSMPGDVEEIVDFKNAEHGDVPPVCFSTYQRELNKLYLIASPAIKQVYSATKGTARSQAHEYLLLVEEVTSHLWQWRQSLPSDLSLDMSEDCPVSPDFGRKAHYLQSLSLHLTFDSVLIILHRPFLKRQMEVLQRHGLGGDHGLGVSGLRGAESEDSTLPTRSSPSGEDATLPGYNSQEQWRKAAARTASVVQQPRLTELACDGHLVAFLAINLFNAAIVMIVLALSDPLTDSAQEAKRAIARIYRLQGALGARSSLSKRSLVVLRDLILLLSRRESESMLANVTWDSGTALGHSNEADLQASHRSIQEALGMPLGTLNSRPQQDILHSAEISSLQPHSRFDQGLDSVQRGRCLWRSNFDPADRSEAFTIPAFPDVQSTDTGNPHGPSLNTDRAETLDESSANVGAGELSQLDIGTNTSEWSMGSADASNGVYWFWDPMWDYDFGTGEASSQPSW